ncbi:MAG: type II toxin-antitoxin system RelE/ParE family toxin [Myxococcales bacterium]|nr:type II toxin-antitoxin system RelE/ParE family toxin [Myxococcales bacterium]
MTIAWRAEALDDLESLRAFIARDDEVAAAAVVSRILDGVELLPGQSAMGRPGRVPRTRELIVPDAPSIVAYRVKDQVVEVLRVLHSSRKWPTQLRQAEAGTGGSTPRDSAA